MLFCNCNMCAGTSNTCHCVVAQQKRLAHDEELKEKNLILDRYIIGQGSRLDSWRRRVIRLFQLKKQKLQQ